MRIPWTRLFFWQIRINKIYTVCPEIRKEIDELKRHRLVRMIRLLLTLPIWLLIFTLLVAFACIEKLVDWASLIIRRTNFEDTLWGKDKGGEIIMRAHSKLSAEEVRDRIRERYGE